MHVRVISLPHATERRSAMRRVLDEAGIAFTFFDALDGRPGLGDEPDRAGLKRLCGRELALSELGCYRSHLTLWRTCAASGQPMMIMEDDVTVAPDLAAVLDWLPGPLERFGFVRLGGHHPVPVRDTGLAAPGGRRMVRLSKGPFGLFGYALSPATAGRLAGACSRITRPVDEQTDRFWEHHILPYAVLPYSVLDDPALASQIDSELVRTGWRPSSWRERVRLKLRRHGDSFRRRLYNRRSAE